MKQDHKNTTIQTPGRNDRVDRMSFTSSVGNCQSVDDIQLTLTLKFLG